MCACVRVCMRVATPQAAVPGPKALLLRGGTYHTPAEGVTITKAHSGLVIQNYDGEPNPSPDPSSNL